MVLPRKRRVRKRGKILKHDIVRYMVLPQPDVAPKLGVSLSTLKRRYYELGVGRWPVNSMYRPPSIICGVEKMYICNILNDYSMHECDIDHLTCMVLTAAFLDNNV
jgi:hypothetical protein